MVVEFNLSVDDDEVLRYNAPPLEFAVQFEISVEFSVKFVLVERRMNKAPPHSDEQWAILIKSV